jgi:hypothetical protein
LKKLVTVHLTSIKIIAIVFLSTGEIKAGIPIFQFPSFNFVRPLESLIKHNESYNETEVVQEPTYIVTFDVILKDLGAGLVLVPVIAILEQIAIAKAFSMNILLLFQATAFFYCKF